MNEDYSTMFDDFQRPQSSHPRWYNLLLEVIQSGDLRKASTMFEVCTAEDSICLYKERMREDAREFDAIEISDPTALEREETDHMTALDTGYILVVNIIDRHSNKHRRRRASHRGCCELAAAERYSLGTGDKL